VDWNFGEVLLAMLAFFFWMTFIWMFIAVFSDIFRRRDLSGWGKAGWIFVVCVLPLLGILIYMVTRPPMTERELRQAQRGYAGGGADYTSPADEISKLSRLQEEGKISPAEYEELKVRVLA
jgi:hypothetical protein